VRSFHRGTFYNWKAKYGGMDVSEARRLKALEDENAKLKKLLAEQMLDAAALRELLHDRDGVIRFPHRRKISSILNRNTVVPIAIRTTLGSCLAIEGRQITENPELL
jgi:putative transposase